jgi:molybdopterin molybdotransferase
MDGYAVRCRDLAHASREQPVHLRQCGIVPAGGDFLGEVQNGQCVRIFTGSPLPSGCDAVVMQEDVTASDGLIRFTEPARPLENVRLRGEDIRAGAVLANAGDRLSAARLGVLAACGLREATVHRRPRIALLATGSELIEPGQSLARGQIFESNRILLAGLAQAAGCEATVLPLVPDHFETTARALENAFAQADVVITTGGVSVGQFDFVKDAFAAIGGSINLWQVAIRPGKPFVFGQRSGQPLFGLPGNPVSALVTFLLLVRPALLRMLGSAKIHMPVLRGRLAEPLQNPGNRRHFMRVRWQEGEVKVCGPQASHMLGSLAASQGLVEIPVQAQLAAGSEVAVHVWEPLAL